MAQNIFHFKFFYGKGNSDFAAMKSYMQAVRLVSGPIVSIVIFGLLAIGPLPATAQIQTLFSPPPQSYRETVDAQGQITETFNGISISKLSKNGLPENFDSWSHREAFYKRRLFIMKAAALTLQGLRFLPIGTLTVVKNKSQTFYRWLKDPVQPTGPAPTLSLDSSSFQELNEKVRAKFLTVLNEVLWSSYRVVGNGNVIGVAAQFQPGGGGAARKSQEMGPVRKLLSKMRLYGYEGLALNLVVNFEKGDVFVELTNNSERLKEVQSFLAELGISTRFSVFVAREEEHLEVPQTTQIFSDYGNHQSAIPDKEGEVFYGFGLGAIVRGPNYVGLGGTIPLIGNIGFPPTGFDLAYVYSTHWKQISLKRLTLFKKEWIEPFAAPTVGASPSCRASFDMVPSGLSADKK